MTDALTKDAKPRSRRRVIPELTPTQRALSLLTRREHSRKELAQKLAVRNIDKDAAQAAIATLTASGWQNDARFAEWLVRSRASTGHGPIRIRAELQTHGLDRDAVATAMATFDGDWAENARDIVRSRFGDHVLDDRALQRKAYDLLMRRGFSAEQVRAAVRLDIANC